MTRTPFDPDPSVELVFEGPSGYDVYFYIPRSIVPLGGACSAATPLPPFGDLDVLYRGDPGCPPISALFCARSCLPRGLRERSWFNAALGSLMKLGTWLKYPGTFP